MNSPAGHFLVERVNEEREHIESLMCMRRSFPLLQCLLQCTMVDVFGVSHFIEKFLH